MLESRDTLYTESEETQTNSKLAAEALYALADAGKNADDDITRRAKEILAEGRVNFRELEAAAALKKLSKELEASAKALTPAELSTAGAVLKALADNDLAAIRNLNKELHGQPEKFIRIYDAAGTVLKKYGISIVTEKQGNNGAQVTIDFSSPLTYYSYRVDLNTSGDAEVGRQNLHSRSLNAQRRFETMSNHLLKKVK